MLINGNMALMNHFKLRAAPFRWAPLALLAAMAGVLPAAPEGVNVILNEDFESYTNTAAMLAVWSGGSAVLETAAPGGGKAALHDGGDLNVSRVFSARPDATHNLVFSADLYDSATNAEKRVTIALRNTNGMNLEFGHINETGPYSLRVVGFATPMEWTSFDSNLQPTRGWNRFQAVISMTNTVVTLDLGAKGKIDKTLTIDGPAPTTPFTNVRFGGLPGRISHGGPVLFDNIKLALVPIGGPGVPAAGVGTRPISSTTNAPAGERRPGATTQ